MPQKRARRTPLRRAPRRQRATDRAAAPEDLLEACRRAVSRVLSGLPAGDREVLEKHRARMVEVTHRDTRAALAEIHGVLERVA